MSPPQHDCYCRYGTIVRSPQEMSLLMSTPWSCLFELYVLLKRKTKERATLLSRLYWLPLLAAMLRVLYCVSMKAAVLNAPNSEAVLF